MKSQILITCLWFGALGWSKAQTNVAQKISQVENGFYDQIMVGRDIPGRSLKDQMQLRKVNGLSVAVIDSGKLAWAKGYGLGDATAPAGKVDTATLFQCASIGKVITAIAALHLVKENKVDLDEDVNQKLKSWKIPENEFTAQHKVTLRTLLSHSAGFTDDYGFAGYEPGKTLPTLLQILNGMEPANTNKKLTVMTVPGKVERYSGAGFLIIQQLIEDVTGMSFADYVKLVVLQPMGLLHTTYRYQPDIDVNLSIARGHYSNGKADKKLKYNVYPELAAAGPWTTASDLARLIVGLQQIHDGKRSAPLDSLLWKQVLAPQINSMGLGIPLKGSKEVSGYWHAGNNAGYTGVLFGVSSTGQGAVVLTNSDGGEWLALDVVRSIANAYQWPIMQSFHPVELPTPEEYTGNYQLSAEDGLVISLVKGQLYFEKKGSSRKFKLYGLADGTFRIAEKPDNLSFMFVRDIHGKILALTMYENGDKVYQLKKG